MDRHLKSEWKKDVRIFLAHRLFMVYLIKGNEAHHIAQIGIICYVCVNAYKTFHFSTAL